MSDGDQTRRGETRRSRRVEQQKAYSGVAEAALGDGLEQGGLAHVGETNDTSLQVVARAAQKDLLLNGTFLGRHLGGSASFRVRASGDVDVDESATRHSGRSG